MRWRKFLETPASGTDSYVAVTANKEDGWTNLKIADCNRNVNLGFSHQRAKREVMLAKIATIQTALDKVRESFGTE